MSPTETQPMNILFFTVHKAASMFIYKIFRGPEWAALEAEGRTAGAPVDLADGYIHFSTAAQAAETAAKHFAGEDGLWLLAVDADERPALFQVGPNSFGFIGHPGFKTAMAEDLIMEFDESPDDPAPQLETVKLFLSGQGTDPHARQQAAAESTLDAQPIECHR